MYHGHNVTIHVYCYVVQTPKRPNALCKERIPQHQVNVKLCFIFSYQYKKIQINIDLRKMKERKYKHGLQQFVLSAMGNLMANRDGTFSETEIAYFEERAKGGTGLILVGQGYLNAALGQGVLGHYWDHHHMIPTARQLTERVHSYGAKIITQLSCGTGRNANWMPEGDLPISALGLGSQCNLSSSYYR